MDTEMLDNDLPVDDAIDQAFSALVLELLGLPADFDETSLSDEMSDEFADDLDEITDLIYEVMDDLIDQGEIVDVPDHEADDAEKQEWVEKAIPKIRVAAEAALKDSEEKDPKDSEEE